MRCGTMKTSDGRFEELERFYKGKTVLVTGHTGFKGSWLTLWLVKMGARVIGYALPPTTEKGIYTQAHLSNKIVDVLADINDLKKIRSVFAAHNPDIVFHLAAQAIVRRSYDEPITTFRDNVLGTMHILEAMRWQKTKAGVMITTDKCYKNREDLRGYTEDDELGGRDPYSASKASAELAIDSHRRSFLKREGIMVASARAGNVIGGGDWGQDRLIPDIINAYEANKEVTLRNPEAVRPWQFVLEPLYGYLLLGKALYENQPVDEAWNFGPDDGLILSVKDVVSEIVKSLNFNKVAYGEGSTSQEKHEAKLLVLNSEKAKKKLGWKSTLSIGKTIAYTAEWYQQYRTRDVYQLCSEQVDSFTSAT